MRDFLEALKRADERAKKAPGYESYTAQKNYCISKGYPVFVPGNGVCYSCHKSIFQGARAITLQEASTRLITGCPYCSTSYVE